MNANYHATYETISRQYANRILDSKGEKYHPYGKYLVIDIDEESGKTIYTAIDNSDGEALTEEFFSRNSAVRWLNGRSSAVDRFGIRHPPRAMKTNK